MTKLALLIGGWSLLVIVCSVSAFAADDPFATNVRPTEALSPADEQKTFQLPDGFEIQLFAAEPDIAKPLNMAFDDRGRLWLTNSVEYPYAAPLDREGRDSIKVLEDTDGDGKADKITTFADGLNIPMGLYPYDDGVIVFSIPHIWHLRDTDGDGKADVRTPLLGPMGYERDTHGMNNAFRRGFDGWLYACHGFNNQTSVQGSDGHVVEMNSGNTYRFRLDGSRIEHFTHGQVNPFGMTFDPWGNQFTADCHSKPVYQLLRDGYYPSFGKPDNGLGFVPPMMNHSHGSTAISGIAYYDDDRFPAEYRGNIFSGNVMTSRVNRNSLVRHGSTLAAKEETDFLSTSDPWFRPVDIQLGPDGALYVADFYNRIIGHYEVPLDHPGRDRTSGRLWRIVYKNNNGSSRTVDLTRLDDGQLFAALDNPNQTLRLQALNRIVDSADATTADEARQFFETAKTDNGRSGALWILQRLQQLSDDTLLAATRDDSPVVRTHAMKVLAETGTWSKSQRSWAVEGLQDADAFVQRAAANALAQHPQAVQISTLVKQLSTIPAEDTHLRYVVRHSLMKQLETDNALETLGQLTLSAADQREIAEVMVAVHSAGAASYLLRQVADGTVPKERFATDLQHIARYLPADQMETLVAVVRKNADGNLELQTEILNSVLQGLSQQGASINPAVTEWGSAHVEALLNSVAPETPTWTQLPLSDRTGGDATNDDQTSPIPWGIRPVPSADGQTVPFIDSRPGGEQAVGRYRSPVFDIPEQLSFYIAGHRGFPDQPAHELNSVRLYDAATHQIVAYTFPPRNDRAAKTTWDLTYITGRQGYLEIVDGDDANAYAWLAVGRFSPEVVELPQVDPALLTARLQTVATLIKQLQLNPFGPKLKQYLLTGQYSDSDQAALAEAIIGLAPESRKSALLPALSANSLSPLLRQQIIESLAGDDLAAVVKTLTDAVSVLPSQVQAQMAQQLIQDRAGAETLLALIDAGKLSPQLLQQPIIGQALPQLLSDEQQTHVASLIQDLPAPTAKTEAAIQTRFANYAAATTSMERGQALFKKQCAVCHRIGAEGALVGPQLDGIGNRGLQRVLEDVLDPNRNVDAAFRTSTIILDDGKVLNGLFRRKTGAILIFANDKGEEFSIPEEQIDEQVTTPISLMPAGYVDTIPEQQFYDLLTFLLAQRGNN